MMSNHSNVALSPDHSMLIIKRWERLGDEANSTGHHSSIFTVIFFRARVLFRDHRGRVWDQTRHVQEDGLN